MGDNPDTAVCDRWGRVHEWDNVIVADSSVFVTATGYGPTLTLVALASRAAHHLADSKPMGPVPGGAVTGENAPSGAASAASAN
jgi:choline dehydrogenase-like flavoprotein